MPELNWNSSTDAYEMIELLWRQPQVTAAELEKQLKRYYLACCRAIWPLLPSESSRGGVEAAEKRLGNKTNEEEYRRAAWEAEGAAFNFDYDNQPELVARLIKQVAAIPDSEVRAMLHPPTAAILETRELLKRAAYFVHHAMIYPGWNPKRRPPPRDYSIFLSAKLLREFLER